MAGELRPRDAGLRAKAMEFPKAALPLSILRVSENSGCFFWGPIIKIVIYLVLDWRFSIYGNYHITPQYNVVKGTSNS